jgi:hypothetical protein
MIDSIVVSGWTPGLMAALVANVQIPSSLVGQLSF